jgi:hypothetical protein
MIWYKVTMEKIVTTSRGRDITQKDIEAINKLITKYYSKGRKYISEELSRYWKWYQPNGNLKDMACREILLKLHRMDIIELPPPRRVLNRKKHKDYTQLGLELPPTSLEGKLSAFKEITLKLAASSKEQALWNSLVRKYHYQGYTRIVGRSIKYIAYCSDIPVACLGWGSGAWSLGPRDKYIGWDRTTKDKNLHFIANNIRFLILPGIKIKYLASHLLSKNIKRIGHDWQDKYGYPLYLLETFVETGRFSGTSYKAANWTYLGRTKGYSKKGASHANHKNIKDIYVYPLTPNFTERMGSC